MSSRLSAMDFLGLAEQRRVARVDLAEAGYAGVVYVCDLSTVKQQEIMAPAKGGKRRVYNDGSMDVDLADIPKDSGPKFLMACLVTDSQGGDLLERAFAATDEPYIVIPASELVWMADAWAKAAGSTAAARQRLEQMPNAVTSLIVRRVRAISGMAEDAFEEKKDG